MSNRTAAELVQEIQDLDFAVREALLSRVITSTMKRLDARIVSFFYTY
jgi:hypothetical protein